MPFGESSLHAYFFSFFSEFVDVYSGVVAPKLQSHLMVSTWRNGRGTKVPRHIKDGRIVDNIELLTFKLGPKKPEVVKNTVDHSKWAISHSPLRYVCVGTLNRKVGQMVVLHKILHYF
ncbi:hypothetical protein HPB48_016625 [Haemaphysalis longicornis]|uniref:Uncharacterized protein n=1 Tax=Haemaphysalis longicornis TaxID=44386 RepID=A0A9J6FRS1_HAELO|nr:hypothetical protein HPB48_016625 [Haemaphysalis longicornis]